MSKERFGRQKIAVVGSSGFVGSYLTSLLNRDGLNVIAMVRKLSSESLTPSTIEIGSAKRLCIWLGIHSTIHEYLNYPNYPNSPNANRRCKEINGGSHVFLSPGIFLL